jgi:hypothetical protein
MTKLKINLSELSFGVQYPFGHLYFDRCGQTLNDIEKTCEGWFTVPNTKLTGSMEKPELKLSCQFSNEMYNITAIKVANETGIDKVISEASILWKIIQANFDIDEFSRIGCHFRYLKPTEGIDESEKLIANAGIYINVPENILKSDFNLNTREILLIFDKNDTYYRMKINGIRRAEGVDPMYLLKNDPRFLSKRQKEYRLQKQKNARDYSRNPMYAVSLDVDCYQHHPKKISVKNFIIEQSNIVKKYYLPILEAL